MYNDATMQDRVCFQACTVYTRRVINAFSKKKKQYACTLCKDQTDVACKVGIG